MYSTPPNCLKSSSVIGWTFISMHTIPSCILVCYLIMHLWPLSVWLSASSTLKPGLEPAAWDWTRPRHKSCGSCQDNSWPRWILMRCHYWHCESMSSMLCEISASSLTASCQRRHRCFSRVSYWLLPAPAAASVLFDAWGCRQKPDPGFH